MLRAQKRPVLREKRNNFDELTNLKSINRPLNLRSPRFWREVLENVRSSQPVAYNNPPCRPGCGTASLRRREFRMRVVSKTCFMFAAFRRHNLPTSKLRRAGENGDGGADPAGEGACVDRGQWTCDQRTSKCATDLRRVGALLRKKAAFMSVHAGVMRIDGSTIDPNCFDMIRVGLNRYPCDGESIRVDGPIGMFYRPFHTTPESHNERQPFLFGRGTMMTWDGRLDNRGELANLVFGESDSGYTDVEIAARAFETWEVDCFRRLRGDWALAIWDPSKSILVLARDYIGVKQLFYCPKPDTILWCNHLAALAQIGDQFHISNEYVAGYLAFKPDARLTPYREIHSVPPGGFVLVRNAYRTEHTFWSFDPQRKTRYASDFEYEEHYRYLLYQSVQRRLRSNAPVLSSLSGGLDSTSMVCVADDLYAKGQVAKRVATVSYYDLSEPDEDDSYHLAKVEKRRGIGGFHIRLTKPEDCLPFDYRHFTPTPGFGMRSEVSVGLAEVVRNGSYRVLLSGTGGDEMNAQALTISVAIADLLARLRFSCAAYQLVAWSRVSRRPLIHLLLSAVLELLPLRIRAQVSPRGKLQSWIKPDFAKKYDVRGKQLEYLRGSWFWRPGPRDSAQTIMTLSNDLTFSSPSNVEERYPYLDQDLVEFLTSVPFEQLLRPGDRRSLMRRALSNLLPREVQCRKTKVSATRCYSLALQKNWKRIEETLAHPAIAELGYVDGQELRNDLLNLRNGICPYHLVRLLKAVSLEFWIRDAASRGVITLSAGSAPMKRLRFAHCTTA
jgi:asparagine synthase (glutamine-hydrolysing)